MYIQIHCCLIYQETSKKITTNLKKIPLYNAFLDSYPGYNFFTDLRIQYISHIIPQRINISLQTNIIFNLGLVLRQTSKLESLEPRLSIRRAWPKVKKDYSWLPIYYLTTGNLKKFYKNLQSLLIGQNSVLTRQASFINRGYINE